MFSSPYSHISLPVVSSPKWNPLSFSFSFSFFEIWFFFCLKWDYGNHFSVLLFKWDMSFFLFYQAFFVFSIWMLRKLRKEKEKNLIRVGFFLGCFVQGNEIEYSSLLSVCKFENFCFTDRAEWGCCWTFIFVKWKWRNFLIFVYFVVCLVILDWFYAFWNPMSTFLFIEYLLVFWIFIYF